MRRSVGQVPPARSHRGANGREISRNLVELSGNFKELQGTLRELQGTLRDFREL
jgi:hypothetical protein